ncbi:MAG: hypothetical protein L3K14_09175 [Thermoplasmata archaeon]|nr:hypothetical protein [Thermoplasmata archaeon]
MTPPLCELVAGSVAIVAALALVAEGVSRLVQGVGMRAGLKPATLIAIRDAVRVLWILIAVVGVAYYTNLASALAVVGNTELLNGPLVNHTATERLTAQFGL